MNEKEILSTIGAYAIAVWQKIEPLVKEARRIENSVLFDDFEALLPACYECYVPSMSGENRVVTPFSLAQPADRISKAALKKRLDSHQPVTLLDVRQDAQFARDPRTIPGAVRMAPDQIGERHQELPHGQEVVVYCA